jgi:hypothetical protein
MPKPRQKPTSRNETRQGQRGKRRGPERSSVRTGPHNQHVNTKSESSDKQRDYSLRAILRRARVPKNLPKPREPGESKIPWAARNREIGRTPLDDVLRVVTGRPWKQIVLPTARRIDLQRRKGYASGQKSVFTLDQILGIKLAQVARGDRRLEDTLVWLSSDQATPLRRALRLDNPHEDRADRRHDRRDGVPDKSTVYAYLRDHLTPALHLLLLRKLDQAYLEELVTHPYFREGCRLLLLDGSKLQIHAKPPWVDKKTREFKNWLEITAFDAGYMSTKAQVKKTGAGYTVVVLATADWLILGWACGAITADERDLARRALEHYKYHFYPLLGDLIGVLSADGNFTGKALRLLCRSLGLIDNFNKLIRGTGTAQDEPEPSTEWDDQRSSQNGDQPQETADDKWPLPLDGHANYFVTRTHDIVCKCRRCSAGRRFHTNADGSITPSVELTCQECGHATITSGRYRYAQNPNRYARVGPEGGGDLTVGHSFTRTDPLAYKYAKTRFSLGEGLFGAFAQRYRLLLPGPHAVRSLTDVNLRMATICVLHHAAAHAWIDEH